MIVLDTNVLSALMQQAPEPRVVAWLDAQPTESKINPERSLASTGAGQWIRWLSIRIARNLFLSLRWPHMRGRHAICAEGATL